MLCLGNLHLSICGAGFQSYFVFQGSSLYSLFCFAFPGSFWLFFKSRLTYLLFFTIFLWIVFLVVIQGLQHILSNYSHSLCEKDTNLSVGFLSGITLVFKYFQCYLGVPHMCTTQGPVWRLYMLQSFKYPTLNRSCHIYILLYSTYFRKVCNLAFSSHFFKKIGCLHLWDMIIVAIL